MLRRSDEYLATKVNDELVMLNIVTGDFIGLTTTAAAVWNALEAPASIDAVCEVLLEKFAVEPVQCRAEVAAFVTDMVARGAILADPAG